MLRAHCNHHGHPDNPNTEGSLELATLGGWSHWRRSLNPVTIRKCTSLFLFLLHSQLPAEKKPLLHPVHPSKRAKVLPSVCTGAPWWCTARCCTSQLKLRYFKMTCSWGFFIHSHRDACLVLSISAQIRGETAAVLAEAMRGGSRVGLQAGSWRCLASLARCPQALATSPSCSPAPACSAPGKASGKGLKQCSASTWLRLTSAALSCRQRHDTNVSDFLVTLSKIHSFPQISLFSLCTPSYQSPAAHTWGAKGRRERL